jgi:dihydropyrimidinase
MHDIVIKNAMVVTPNSLIQGGVAIKEEKIVAVGESGILGAAHRVIDAEGKILFPGLFDPHFHLGNGDEVGYEAMREDFLLESREMAVSGVTTFATTNLYGPGSIVEGFEQTLACGLDNCHVDFKITCCVSLEDQIKEMAEVARRGCVDFKFFTGYKGSQAESLGMGAQGITLRTWYLACEEMARIGPPVFPKIHAEDPWVRELLLERIRAQGRDDYLVAWAEHTPGYGENLQIYDFAVISDQFKVPLYVVHISCAESIELIKYLMNKGVRLIAETTPAFLCGDAAEMQGRNLAARAKIQPPIRFEKDNLALWQAVEDGTISVIGTDSLPYTTTYKDSVGFWESRVGLNCQVPATIPLMISQGYDKGRVGLIGMAKILSENAARLYGIYPQKGAILPGSDADLVVIDPDREHVLTAAAYRGKSDYSIWEGRKAKGLAVMTLRRGEVIAEDGEVVAVEPRGRHLTGLAPRGI